MPAVCNSLNYPQTTLMLTIAVVPWILLQGKKKEVTEDNERTAGIKKLMALKIEGIASETVKLSPIWPFISDEISDETEGIVFSIRFSEKAGRFERSEYHGVSS